MEVGIIQRIVDKISKRGRVVRVRWLRGIIIGDYEMERAGGARRRRCRRFNLSQIPVRIYKIPTTGRFDGKQETIPTVHPARHKWQPHTILAHSLAPLDPGSSPRSPPSFECHVCVCIKCSLKDTPRRRPCIGIEEGGRVG